MVWIEEQEMDQQTRDLAILLIIVGIGSVIYLGSSIAFGGFGFPLDDAWIHQTYARNLAHHGEWAFIPGESSAGSTAPLWTAALSIGHLIGLYPPSWAYLIGIILLAFTAWLSGRWFVERNPMRWSWVLFIAGAIALEWHLVWAALSGMETIALSLLVIICFMLLERGKRRSLGVGVLIGVAVWVRPDAITLLIPAGLALLLRERRSVGELAQQSLELLFGTALLFVPYLYFNFMHSGEVWPSTFFAKQQEYAILRDQPLIGRLGPQFALPFIGAGILLLPGLLSALIRHIRRRRWLRLVPIIWAASYLGLYAWRLPVTYQHGRYVMPVIPVLFVIGLEGVFMWAQPGARRFWRRVISRAWLTGIGLLTVGFVVLGARAYRQDVAIIESEMVQTARWLQVNTPPSAVIAAHDIGAIGYFADRELVDLAGSVSPEVIPFMRDEAAIKRYLDRRGADYLVTFPGWYPQLSRHGELVYRTEAPFSPDAGGENMRVYAWP
jgi:hypothetical protein